MNSYSEPSPEQEVVGGGAQSVPDPKTSDPHIDDPEQLGGEDTVEANDDLTVEEVER